MTELKVFSETLNSYTCEPKTYKLYERLQMLRNRIRLTLSNNQDYIDLLKQQDRLMELQVEAFKKRLQEFQDLEHAILDYIGRARLHC